MLPTGTPATPIGPKDVRLVSYRSCDALARDLRAATATRVTADGLPGTASDLRLPAGVVPAGAPVAAAGSASASSAAGSATGGASGGSSTTNDQEVSADEPDEVKTVGDRVVTLTGGVLHVVDAGTRRITGSLDLSLYAGSDGAQLLVSGDRALVVLASDGGGVRVPANVDLPYRSAAEAGFLLVRLTGTPAVVGTFRPDGSYVGARLVNGTIRLVVTSAPRLTFPQPGTAGASAAANRAVVRRAPVGAWLPRWTVSSGAITTSGQVGCGAVARPASSLTGTATTTVYSVDPARGFTDLAPVSVAAASSGIYATARSLYLLDSDGASGPDSDGAGVLRTEIHRFDITTPGRPRYVASGAVAGQLLNSYSLSDAGGFLRVVTTTGGAVDEGGPIPVGGKSADAPSTTLSVLDAATLRRVGHVDGLGRTEQVYAVRFVGDLGFVVTFRRIDPLHVLDLRDPRHPRLAGTVQADGYSSYLHPVGTDRLLGVGTMVGADNEPSGLQLSLFDVSRVADPARIDRIVRHGTAGAGTDVDPHTVLYWPAAQTAVVPLDGWDGTDAGAVLVVRVGQDRLRSVGTVTSPVDSSGAGAIERSFIVDGALWTLAPAGVLVSDLTTLHRQAWLPFT